MKTYKIMEKKQLWFGISLIIIGLGLIFMISRGFNWSIDFTGGIMLHFDINENYQLDEARQIMENFSLKDFKAKKAGDNHQELIVRTVELSEETQREILNAFKQKWQGSELIRVEKTDAVIGKEMQKKAIIALILANLGILLYITLRFEFKSALAAVIVLAHDVLIVLSFYAIFNIPVDSSIIAVILTIVGYSINDTIVVFDRIRENLKSLKKAYFDEVANISISQTLNRSINTSLTTLFTITALYFFGGETIKDFTLALIIGIISGTYSSIFIASSLWSIFREKARIIKT